MLAAGLIIDAIAFANHLLPQKMDVLIWPEVITIFTSIRSAEASWAAFISPASCSVLICDLILAAWLQEGYRVQQQHRNWLQHLNLTLLGSLE